MLLAENPVCFGNSAFKSRLRQSKSTGGWSGLPDDHLPCADDVEAGGEGGEVGAADGGDYADAGGGVDVEGGVGVGVQDAYGVFRGAVVEEGEVVEAAPAVGLGSV